MFGHKSGAGVDAVGAHTADRGCATCDDQQHAAGAIVEYVVELVGFPSTKYDDQVDSTTQALDHMREDDDSATYLNSFGR